MFPAERATPAAMWLCATSATKRATEQNADYVPEHIIGQKSALNFARLCSPPTPRTRTAEQEIIALTLIEQA
jgi:hypothetical protein